MKPLFLFNIDVIGACNLHCPSCPQGNTDERLARGSMSPDMLRAIIKKAKSECVLLGVDLFNWTEPFLHSKLPELLDVLNENQVLAYLSSNFNKLPNLDEVMKREPHSIRISCSGFRQETYGLTHAGGEIERVKRNIEAMANSPFRSKKTNIHMLWHRYTHNADDEPLMKEFLEKLGIEFRPIEAYYMPLEKVLTNWENNVDAPVPLITPLTEHKRLCGGREAACRMQTQEMTLDAYGNVMLCCAVYDPSKYKIANFLEKPLAEIQEVRLNHSMCGKCASAGGHIYAMGQSHHAEPKWRQLAKKVYRMGAYRVLGVNNSVKLSERFM